MGAFDYMDEPKPASWQVDAAGRVAAEKRAVAEKAAEKADRFDRTVKFVRAAAIKMAIVTVVVYAFLALGGTESPTKAIIAMMVLWLIPFGISVCLATGDIWGFITGRARLSIADGNWYLGWKHKVCLWVPVVVFVIFAIVS